MKHLLRGITLLLLFVQSAFAQPANDNCINASTITITNGGYGLGLFTSSISDLTQATVQTGETFAPSIFTMGQTQKSVWYKFTTTTRRKVRVSLKQQNSQIIAGDVGFAVYTTNSCLPTNSQLSTYFSSLETFGTTFHPCVEAGTYYIQVSSRATASGPIYVEIETEETNAIYDKLTDAYEFGVLNQHAKSVTYSIACHNTEQNEPLCNTILPSNYNKTTWHTFVTPNYFDYINLALTGNSAFTNANQNHIIGFRIFQGNALLSNFNTLTPIYTCDTFVTNGINVAIKRFLCGTFSPNTTYSIQLIFASDFNSQIKLGVFTGGTTSTNGPTASTTGMAAANQLGILNAGHSVTDVFACNARHSTNSCGPTKPASGVVHNNITYNLSSYFTFTLSQASNLEMGAYLNNNVCGSNLLVRVFNTGLTTNCNDLTLANLYAEFTATKLLTCLEPGNYTIQVLSSDSGQQISNVAITNSSNSTCIQSNLSRSFTLNLYRYNAPVSQIRLHQAGAFNNINTGVALAPNSPYTSVIDYFGCEQSVLPSNIGCINPAIDRAKYRQFTLADSGQLNISNLPINYNIIGGSYLNTYQLFGGNANSLAVAQNAFNPNQTITGLNSIVDCISSTNNYAICMVPGEYTFVEYGDTNFVNSMSNPTFRLNNSSSTFGNYLAPNNLGDIVATVGPTGGTVTGNVDTFTCNNNAITVGGVSPCSGFTKAIYREFFVSDSVFLRIRSLTLGHPMSFFRGRISTQNPSALTPLWECFEDRRSADCEWVTPGWYTVVSYGAGPTYGIVNYSGPNAIGTANNISIQVEFDCRGPKYNRPHKAAIDTATGNPFLITWNQAADTGIYPNTRVFYDLPRDSFNCTMDTPYVYTTGCNPAYTRVTYYVFELTQESYLNVQNVSPNYISQVYSGNIRVDSLGFATRQPLSNCNSQFNRLEICKMQPGVYTLVVYSNSRCTYVSPRLIIDKVGTSRFDHALNSYDFDTIVPNNTFQWGKVGDVNPLNANRAASSDFFYCTTGAFSSDPNDANCNTTVDNAFYSKDTNAISVWPSSVSALVKRNLWHTFVVNKPGTYTIKVDAVSGSRTTQLPFAIYKSDVNGNLPFTQVVQNGLVDSTIAQGLEFIAKNGSCNALTNELRLVIPECNYSGAERYYIVTQNRNVDQVAFDDYLNNQIEIGIKLDTTSLASSPNDFYATAFDMGTLLTSTNRGQQSSYFCATRNASYPTAIPVCGQKTLWYKFTIPAALNAEAKIRLHLDSSYYTFNNSDVVLYRENIANDSTATGLTSVPLTAITGFQKACVSTGTYYLLLTGCNRTDEMVIPEIVVDTLLGDYCYNAMPVFVNSSGVFSSTASIDCHTIGTDYGEFNPTLTCPYNGVTQDYKSTWFKLEVSGNDTLDINISLTENLNASANQIFYRMMSGDCNAMTEQGCVQDILTQNTYSCMMPNTSYYIQVFTPAQAGPNTPTIGSITLNAEAVNHVDTCAPTNYCNPVANFTTTIDCDSIHTQNYSTYGSAISYLWDFEFNNVPFTSINPTVSFPKILRDTTYSVTLRVVNSICQDTSWISSNVFVPATPGVDLGSDTFVCNVNDSLTLDVTFPGATYVWSTGDTTGAIKVGAPGSNTYHVTLTYHNCNYTDTITVFKTRLVRSPLDTIISCRIVDTITIDANRNLANTTYLWSTSAVTPSISVSNMGLYTVTVADAYCSVIDSTLIRAEIDSVYITDSVCANQLPYSWNNQTIASFGTNVAYHIYAAQQSCDSLVFLSLVQKIADTTVIRDTVCTAGLPYNFFGTNINGAGNYSHVLSSATGCDSIITLHLQVTPSYNVSLPQSICAGDTFAYNGFRYTVAGNYVHNFVSSNGCDSNVTLQLTVNPYLLREQFDTICANQTYTLPTNVVVSASGTYIDTLTNTNSCDSIVTIHLFKRAVNSGVANITVCENQLPYIWNNISITSGGMNRASYTATDRFGCDSVTTLNLTVNPVDTTVIVDTICSSQGPYVFYTNNLNASGVYFHTLNSSLNCDSIIRLQLQVNPSYRDTFTVTICSNDVYSYNGVTYNTSGYYTHNFNTNLACDSVRILNLIVTPTIVHNLYDTICNNGSYTRPSNIVVTNSGTYYDTLSRVGLCDSIVISHIFRRDVNNGVANLTICQAQLPYTWNGIVLTGGGNNIATYPGTDRFGCDSVTTLNLTVNPNHATTLYDTVCTSTLPYVFYSNTINVAGTYTHTLLNQFGCDSVLTLHLSIYQSYSDTTRATICSGTTYSFEGLNYSVSGTFTHNYFSGRNCDSNKVLVLTVTPASAQPIVASPLFYCLNDNSVPLTALGQNLTWHTTPSGGASSSIAPTPNTSVLGRQVYYVAQTTNGCPSLRDSIEVFVSEKLVPNFDVIPDSVNCTNDTILYLYTGQSVSNMILEWIWDGAIYVHNAHPNYYANWNMQGTKQVGLFINNNGCISDTLYKNVHIHQNYETPKADFKKSYCIGDRVTIDITSGFPNNTRYHWTFNGNVVTATTSFSPVVASTGWHYFTVFAESDKGCYSNMLRDSFYVSAYPVLNLKADVAEVCEQDTITLNYSHLPNTTFTFEPSYYFPNTLPSLAAGNKYAFISVPGYIYTTATNQYNCSTKDSLFVGTHACCDIFVPNAFSPNGDGLNDLLSLYATNLQQIQVFSVYNRFGQLVFKSNSQFVGWDGTLNNQTLDAGVYFYYLEYTCSDGTKYTKKGDITLLY